MRARLILVPFAGLVDGFQISASAFLTAWGGTIGGAAGGCAVGAYVAGKTGCAVGAVVGGFFGTWLNGGPMGIAMGAMLGYILSLCITFSFGLVLLVWLGFGGHLKGHGWNVFITFFLKIIPLAGLTPAWGRLAWVCTEDKPPHKAALLPHAQTA